MFKKVENVVMYGIMRYMSLYAVWKNNVLCEVANMKECLV